MATKNKSTHQGQRRICLYLICSKNGFGYLSPCSSYNKTSLLRNGDYFLSAMGTASPPLVPTSSWPWVAGWHGPSLVVIGKVPCFISSGPLSSLAVALVPPRSRLCGQRTVPSFFKFRLVECPCSSPTRYSLFTASPPFLGRLLKLEILF